MKNRPYVLVNMAVTADGKVDTVERRGARISGPADSTRVERLRAEADAVMVGGHTLLREDPRLTIRNEALSDERTRRGRPAQPTKIGIVSQIGVPGEEDSLPPNSRFIHEGDGLVIVCTTARTKPAAVDWLHDQGAEVKVHGSDRVDLAVTFAELPSAGIERLMVEGGGTLVAALLAAHLVDEIQLAMAPLVFGGEDAPTPVGGPGLDREHAIDLTLADATENEEGDVILRYLVNGVGAP